MTDYTFIRRYDTPIYWCMLVLVSAVSLAFAAATIYRTVFLVFAVLFAFIAYVIIAGIRHRFTSGLTMTDTTLAWWTTGNCEGRDQIAISDIQRANWQHIDAEWITLTTRSGTQRKLDERYFGAGEAFLSALASRSADVELLDNGSPWRGC